MSINNQITRTMQALSLKELSLMYFPTSSVKSAGTQLKRWLRYNTALWDDLAVSGYRNGQRLLTPRQVALVFHYLGEP